MDMMRYYNNDYGALRRADNLLMGANGPDITGFFKNLGKSLPKGVQDWFGNVASVSVQDKQGVYKLKEGVVEYETLPNIPTGQAVAAQEVQDKKIQWSKVLPYAVPIGLFLLRK